MKKLLYILIFALCVTMFSCAEDKTVTHDVWDGTVATSFASGEGTKDSPFAIKICSQLAFMAECINRGEYTDAYFVLENDLDLNGIEWTPIGNGYSAFKGSFDGNGKNIKNLNITKSIEFTYYVNYRTIKYGIAGLFGACSNSVIENLTIQNASVSSEMVGADDVLSMGILSGFIKKSTDNNSCFFRNIKISESKISIPNNNNDGGEVTLGGISGYSNSYCKLDCINVDITIDTTDRYINANSIGGLIGKTHTRGVECTNSAVYLTALCPSDELSEGIHYVGAFGYINPYEEKTVFKNIFSKITTNQKSVVFSHSERPARSIQAIVGMIQTHDTSNIVLENLFGCVIHSKENFELNESGYGLYNFFKDVNYTETNCKFCKELPENHEFDTNVWDLSDKSNPVVK